MNTKLSQPFFCSLVLRSFLRASSSTTNAVPIYNGFHDLAMRGVNSYNRSSDTSNTYPDRCCFSPFSSAISIHPLDPLRFLL